ncbi:acyltransferase family protein [Saccharopolyspora erythraea]|nr:acyltransferase [Saccharopolyspora erythraea]
MGDARVVHARPELFASPNHGFAWIRMIGALVVIYGHSSPLVGTGELFPPEWPVQPDEGVLMGFFAMSGFQITESWIRDPHPARFAAKRVLRLWPPMLTVTLGMALVVGPMVTTLPVGEYFSAHGTWGYIVNNAGMLTLKHELPGVFTGNPWPDAVNGSLWTLPMELLAYGGLYTLLLLGAGKQRYRWLSVVALVGLVAWDRHLEDTPGAESAGSLLSVPIESLVAFLVAFALGVVLNLYRVPLSPVAAAAGLGVLVLMPNNQVGSFLMTFAVSYAVIVTGHFWPSRLEVPGVWVNGSYGVYVWGFPIQQLLAMAGIANQYLMLVCAAPLAYVMGTLSWKYVEDPTMRLRHYITPAQPEPSRKPSPSLEDEEHGEADDEPDDDAFDDLADDLDGAEERNGADRRDRPAPPDRLDDREPRRAAFPESGRAAFPETEVTSLPAAEDATRRRMPPRDPSAPAHRRAADPGEPSHGSPSPWTPPTRRAPDPAAAPSRPHQRPRPPASPGFPEASPSSPNGRSSRHATPPAAAQSGQPAPSAPYGPSGPDSPASPRSAPPRPAGPAPRPGAVPGTWPVRPDAPRPDAPPSGGAAPPVPPRRPRPPRAVAPPSSNGHRPPAPDEDSVLARRLSGAVEPPSGPRPAPPARGQGGRHARPDQRQSEEETRPAMRSFPGEVDGT